MDKDEIPIELAIRIVAMILWLLLLGRANFYRIRGLHRQFRSRSNGLRLLVTKERVTRIVIKNIWWVLMAVNIVNRMIVDDLQLRSQIADVDQLLIIIFCGIGLLLSDEYYTDKIVAYNEYHYTVKADSSGGRSDERTQEKGQEEEVTT